MFVSPLLLQVRVHVIEGRKLEGGHISPAVKILCGTDSREVSGGKGSNNPYFNRVSIRMQVCVRVCMCVCVCVCVCMCVCLSQECMLDAARNYKL